MTGVSVMIGTPGGHIASYMVATMPGGDLHAANDDSAEMAVGFRRPRHSMNSKRERHPTPANK